MSGKGPEKILGVEIAGPKESANKWTRDQFESAMAQLRDITSDALLADELSASGRMESIKDTILVQLALVKLGYRPGTVDGLRTKADGSLSQTTQAIMQFQRDSGIEQVGTAGPRTFAALISALRSRNQPAQAGIQAVAADVAVARPQEPVAAPVPMTAPPVPQVTAEDLPAQANASEATTRVIETPIEGVTNFNGVPYKNGDTVSMDMEVDGRPVGVVGKFEMKTVETVNPNGSGTIKNVYELCNVITVLGRKPVSDRVDISSVNFYQLTNLSANTVAAPTVAPGSQEIPEPRRRGAELFDRYQLPEDHPLSANERRELARWAYTDAEHLAQVRGTLPIDSHVLAAQLDPETYRAKVTDMILVGYKDGAAYSHMALPYLQQVGHSRQTAEQLIASTKVLDPGRETAFKLVPTGTQTQSDQERNAYTEPSGIPDKDYSRGESIIQGSLNVAEGNRGMRFLEAAANQGHVKAQSLAGAHYAFGTKVAANYQKALYYLRPAAEAGDKYAQGNLAHMLYFGLGTRQDLEGALAWADKAAAQGVEPATKLQEIIREKKAYAAVSNPLSDLPESASPERLEAVMVDVRARVYAGKKYGLPFDSDQNTVLDAIDQLMKRGENAKATELITMSRQIIANAAGDQEATYGKFGRELTRLEASGGRSGARRAR